MFSERPIKTGVVSSIYVCGLVSYVVRPVSNKLKARRCQEIFHPSLYRNIHRVVSYHECISLLGRPTIYSRRIYSIVCARLLKHPSPGDVKPTYCPKGRHLLSDFASDQCANNFPLLIYRIVRDLTLIKACIFYTLCCV